MTLDELCGHVIDVLADAPLSASQMTQALLARTNGADLERLLAAALSIARQRIAELELVLNESAQDYWDLEDEMRELREQIKELARKCEPKGKAT